MDFEKIDQRLEKIEKHMDSIIYILGCTGLLLAIIVYAYNIWDWWLFKKRIPKADEIALLGLIWTSYAGLGLLFHIKGHCTMDFIVEMLHGKARILIFIIRDILMIIVSLVAVYYSWKLAIKSFNKVLVISKIPYFYCDISLTVGYAHLLIVVFIDFLRSIVKLFSKNTVSLEEEISQ